MRALLTSFLILALFAPGWAGSERSLVFVQWTDIHHGCQESRPSAWHEALCEGAELHPRAILLTGDNVDNKCSPEDFRRRTEGFLSRYGPRILGLGVPVVLALGNNDFADNHQTAPESLAPVLAAYRRHLGRSFYLDDLGNGVHPQAVGGMAWITLNSQFFSPENQYENRGGQADRTFRWLEAELGRVPPGRPVVLVSHIPPTFDLYSRGPAWRPADMQRLQALLAARQGPVAVVSGHFHRNELHALSLPGGRAVPILAAGSLSAKYGAEPNWRVHQWLMDSEGVPEAFRYRLHYPGHPDWSRAWRLDRPFSSRAWSAFVGRLAADRPLYGRYMLDFWAHNREALSVVDAERDIVLHEVFVDTSGRGAPTGLRDTRREAVACGG